MANREACELYIEQQIQDGLEVGKTPYSIGQELSDWVAKLFEVRIKPGTLKQRAMRQQAKMGTNVPKKSKTQSNQIVTDTPKLTDRGGKRENAGRPSRVVFNTANEKIDWAKWSWNPYTGCLHGCPYCYARDIANRFYRHGFEPTFKPHQLKAPYNTRIPKDRKDEPGINNVFVCSMADLFGDWVDQNHIDEILKVCKDTPQWNYIFLTKNPRRLPSIKFPQNAWIGTTIDCQARVEPAEDAFRNVKATVKFVSCEPLQESIKFNDIDIFDWLIIGGRSRNSKMPAFQPERKWVLSLLQQAHGADVMVYCKPNLTSLIKEYPKRKR